MDASERRIPASVLIIGSGVFGLSTAYSLATDPKFEHTSITLVDRHPFPSPQSSSIDASRIIRSDYADPAYASLAAEAQSRWRGDFGAQSRYHESGLVLTAERGREPYITASLANVLSLVAEQNACPDTIRPLRSPAEIAAACGTLGASGATGYLNAMSGWADAEASMRHLYEQLRALDRVAFVTATVERLLFSSDTVYGCVISPSMAQSAADPNSHSTIADSTTHLLHADLTVLAAGAWTPTLVDLRGVCTATAQAVAYLPLTAAEQNTLGKNPTLLNLTSGVFAITPSSRLLKIARHSHGYTNPVRIPHPERPYDPALPDDEDAADAEHIAVSVPAFPPALPEDAVRDARRFLFGLWSPHSGCGKASIYPRTLSALPTRAFSSTRLCWYADTPTGDFLITYHPTYSNLFLATGGSGHAFKFLPVIGDKVVACMLGQPPDAFREKWAWPKERLAADLWTGDGSRGGKPGMVLMEELAKQRGSL